MGESDFLFGILIEELFGEERVLIRQCNCFSESDFQCGVMGDGGVSGFIRGERSVKLESDILIFIVEREENLQDY